MIRNNDVMLFAHFGVFFFKQQPIIAVARGEENEILLK